MSLSNRIVRKISLMFYAKKCISPINNMKKIISIKVSPKSSVNKVEKFDSFYKVWLKTAPEKGKANNQLIALLASHFKVKKSAVLIISGTKMRKKLVEVEE